MRTAKSWALIALLSIGGGVTAEEIGSVNTVFKWVGPDHKIVIDAFDDPDVPGVACYVSRAKTGGVKGALGLAEDTADASIACRQVGPITLPERVASRKADGEQVFKEHLSILFKTLQVVRFYDAKRNTLIYLTYSDKLVEGSPKNSVAAVPVEPWGRN
ncbi:MAG TPA: protein CreA [Magnetospirillaceae bacterium]|nr:protein CreA [Magnetospirillaceae bacterium]